MQATDSPSINSNTNTPHYSLVATMLHWTVAICFLLALGLGIAKGYIPKDSRGSLMFLHKSLGLSVLFLMVIRVLWRFTHKPPSYPESMASWEKKFANSNHILLYILALLIPMSGLTMSSAHNHASSFWGLFAIQLPIHSKTIGGFAKSFHYYAAWVVGSLLLLHIFAIIKHQYIDKDNILARMLRFKK